jgi:hypothetical protein
MVKDKNELFRELIRAEGECPANRSYAHRWTKNERLSEYKLWMRRCVLCGAIELWRGNDTIYYRPKTGHLIVFHHKYDFTDEYKARELLKKVLGT